MKKNKLLKIIIFASGTGSNAQALIDFAKKNPKLVEVCALVSDKDNAYALERTRKAHIPAYFVPHKNEEQLLDLIHELKPDWACLAGYMRIMSKSFLQCFFDQSLGFYKVINIHPALLPAFAGLHAYERAFQAGVKISGITVHLVDEGVDTGRPILQATFERKEKDTLESFKKRGLALEHKLYVQALKLAAKNRIRIITIPGTEVKIVGTNK